MMLLCRSRLMSAFFSVALFLQLIQAAASITADSDNIPEPRAGICSWARYGYPLTDRKSDACPRPVSDSTGDNFEPWSYPPYCIRAARNVTAGTRGRKYCVYTSRTFRGRGLSVISTPQMAANLVASLDDTRVVPRLRDHAASSMARKDAQRDSTRPYIIKNVSGARGKGLVARRRVPKWGEALVGFPIMIAHVEFLQDLGDADRKRLEDRAMRQLPVAAQNAILSLAHSAVGYDDNEFQLEYIFRSNIFGIEVAGQPHFALQIEGSRINHDCRPNTFWRYSPSTMTHEVIAFREISIGEEFTHSYIPLGLPKAERQEAIQKWGFSCHCSLCMADKSASFASEVRRTRLVEIYTTMESEAQGGFLTREKIETLFNEMMMLINGEDLAPQLCEYYAMVALAYLSIEAFEDARYFAQRSEEFWIRYGSEEHDNVNEVRALWKSIESKENEREKRVRRRRATS